MRPSHQFSLASAVLMCAISSAAAQNLNNIDRLEPVVRASPVKGEPTEPSDFWGWSAVLHSVVAAGDGDNMLDRAANTRIMVGAPKGTFPGGLLGLLPDPGMPAANITGLVYSCPVRPGACEGVRGNTAVYLNNQEFLDNTGSTTGRLRQGDIEGRLFDQAPNAIVTEPISGSLGLYENKTAQLLGATLISTGDQFVACAPRWTFQSYTDISSTPRGTCYASGRNLQDFEQLYPCQGNGAPTTASGEGYCLASVGINIVNDQYVIGAPGGYFGSGALYYRGLTASGDSFMRQNARTVTQTTTNVRLPDHYAYQGYKVTGGNIRSPDTGTGQTEVLATVPRYGDNYYGAVYFYDVNDRSVLLPIDITGSQMGEFFGYSIAAVDLNGDGYDEVIVGAPMYSDIGLSKIEKGRVYVFMNMQGTLDETPITLERSTPLSRFGTSVENLGDIDDDGLEDVAIGAPYTPLDGGNSGVVFIYYGKRNFADFANQQPQAIYASQIVSVVSSLDQLQTFGWSLSGRADVDNNKFNDLLIGAYKSQVAILLRALPVVNLTATIDPVAGSVDLDAASCTCSVRASGMCPCFMATVRANFVTIGDTDALTVNFTLRERNDESRLFFNPASTSSNVYSGTFSFASSSDSDSDTITVFAANTSNFDPYQLEVVVQPIERELSVVVTGNQEITSLAAVPKIRQTGDPTQTVMVMNPCGEDSCQSDVRLQVSSSNVSVLAGVDTMVDLNVTYSNVGVEDALDVRLRLEVPSIFSGVSIIGGGSVCMLGVCALEPRLRPNEERALRVRWTIDPFAIVGDEGTMPVAILLEVNSDSGNSDVNPSNNERTVSFVVTASADITMSLQFSSAEVAYSPDPVDAPSVTVVDELGPRLDLVVTIQNAGPTPIPNANVTILFPSRTAVTGNFYFLYPAELSNSNGTICTTSVDFNPSNLLLVSQAQITGNRRRRSAWSIGRHQRRRRALLDQHSRSTRQASQPTANSLMCSGSPAECISITCSITRLSGSATITIESYVDERFFFDKEGTYTFEASGSADILDTFLLPEDATNNIDSSEVRVSRPPVILTDGPNIYLVTIIPIIGGLILVAILAVLLYFVGFFRRKKRPEEQEAEGDFDVTQYKGGPPEESTDL